MHGASTRLPETRTLHALHLFLTCALAVATRWSEEELSCQVNVWSRDPHGFLMSLALLAVLYQLVKTGATAVVLLPACVVHSAGGVGGARGRGRGF